MFASGQKITAPAGGTFAGKDIQKSEEGGSLFGSAPGKPLFGSGEAPVKEPLFKAAAGGTFAGKKLPEPTQEEKKPAAPTGSLFGGSKPA